MDGTHHQQGWEEEEETQEAGEDICILVTVTNSDAPDRTFPDPWISPTCASGKEHVESVWKGVEKLQRANNLLSVTFKWTNQICLIS